jgi:acetoin utilization deacetylase AcuC-like enzyme
MAVYGIICSRHLSLSYMSTAYISHSDSLKHHMGDKHPESPDRIRAIEDQLILSRVEPYLTYLESPLASEDQLNLIHTWRHIETIKERIEDCETRVIDADTSMNPSSYQAALRSVGAAILGVDAVMSGQVKNAFACTRPPGHHAEPDKAMGFCFFNNIAIAAKYALEKYSLKRVAIIDFDVHHGNGTEIAFINDPRVVMCSFFQHPYYPYSEAIQNKENLLNIPVPAYSDGKAVRELIETHWLPKLHQFKPEFIFISAGFDAHREDEMGQLGLVEADYAWMTKELMKIADEYSSGRIVSCLEGGYHLSSLARSVVVHLKELAELS